MLIRLLPVRAHPCSLLRVAASVLPVRVDASFWALGEHELPEYLVREGYARRPRVLAKGVAGDVGFVAGQPLRPRK